MVSNELKHSSSPEVVGNWIILIDDRGGAAVARGKGFEVNALRAGCGERSDRPSVSIYNLRGETGHGPDTTQAGTNPIGEGKIPPPR